MKSKNIQVTVGEAAHLQCTATGDAPLELTWRSPHHHTIAHHLDQRYTIREQVLDDGLVSELSILQTYRQDTGALTCRASNTYGQDEMLIHLVVQEVPEMPKNIRIIDQQSRSIQISWTQPYAGNSPIINYIVQYKEASEPWPTTPQKVIVPGSVTSASVQNLQPATSYHVRIIAENRLGQSEPSQLVQLTTTEEGKWRGFLTQWTAIGCSSGSKKFPRTAVTWEPPQRDLWNGNILGYDVGFQELNSNTTAISPSGPGGASYTVRTVEGAGAVPGAERARTTLAGLQKHASYAVVVQAYNSRGAGPASLPVTATTMEDVPSLPPGALQCAALSSQSVRVSWEPPPPRGRNGALQGYRVTYAPVTDWYGNEEAVTKQIPGLHTTLSGLRRYTNYSVTVCAFTGAGDGVRAAPVYCHTEEDVPSAPADIKAVVSSRNKILVSWLPPTAPNGVLIGYTLYMSVIEDGREASEGTHKRMLSPSTLSHETGRSPPRATHQFWVSASTRLGEGEATRVVTVLPTESVPARITSFSRNIITPWKENISLTCNKVGFPTPTTVWNMNGAALEPTLRKNVTSEGTLVISMTQYADSGNYTCIVENAHGHDSVTYGVEVKVPPQPPVLAVVDSYADSLHLQWSDQGDGGSPILGYVINYKREHGDWEELQVEAGTSEHVLPNLWCGTRYQLYITAFNRIGTGLPCDIVHAYTKGTVPVKPKHSQMITLNTTTVTVWLDSWGDGGCGILYFVIEYREMSHSQWRLVSNSVQATERVFSVPGLAPGTQHQLRITAHNNAGYAVALYNFTTHSLTGLVEGEVSPPVQAAGARSLGGARVLLPAALSLLVLGALIAIVFLVRRNKNGGAASGSADGGGAGESPSVAQLQNKANRDQQYLATRAQQQQPPHQYKHASNEYIEDICPYATFQLTKPSAYSESSYSGNVYSGPYHSVRGSFVYHDLKQTDKYKAQHGKEPEYTKVRRKGGRLRDPHSESQESDNLGSTDSEVKKILTLHLPITEYEDDASDDGSAPRSDSEPARPPRPPHPHRPPSYPSVEREESSSSSETSLGGAGVLRKAFPSRKGKAGALGKRHVRSSSGYSSHNDETTFSISNYPSFNEHIHPPSRFSDDNECEGHHRRKRHQHAPADKITREAFQINV
ncbi:Down syndrome cell adhesion molecule-like protein Dscam2 [Eumeta japonica]|uniref:Down syndrome cell adhesion molecule-like protein Dscam2 n=1 Tax=Eumeta variegata TaxID=151549 RepID=A0A4C1X4Z0_EUMVA|nr:Down syndrome cell adhesion molecule-like protein Dscam2 [Eumeta japonica]